ncbi:hypothetical protein MPSEU_000914900 [Mayamaea pseudoterrestris]|nr:hypothetical protein MPSEU_000914900 [Mayamaea pseudoterrestris]
MNERDRDSAERIAAKAAEDQRLWDAAARAHNPHADQEALHAQHWAEIDNMTMDEIEEDVQHITGNPLRVTYRTIAGQRLTSPAGIQSPPMRQRRQPPIPRPVFAEAGQGPPDEPPAGGAAALVAGNAGAASSRMSDSSSQSDARTESSVETVDGSNEGQGPPDEPPADGGNDGQGPLDEPPADGSNEGQGPPDEPPADGGNDGQGPLDEPPAWGASNEMAEEETVDGGNNGPYVMEGYSTPAHPVRPQPVAHPSLPSQPSERRHHKLGSKMSKSAFEAMKANVAQRPPSFPKQIKDCNAVLSPNSDISESPGLPSPGTPPSWHSPSIQEEMKVSDDDEDDLSYKSYNYKNAEMDDGLEQMLADLSDDSVSAPQGLPSPPTGPRPSAPQGLPSPPTGPRPSAPQGLPSLPIGPHPFVNTCGINFPVQDADGSGVSTPVSVGPSGSSSPPPVAASGTSEPFLVAVSSARRRCP